jgi:hypothetical protein
LKDKLVMVRMLFKPLSAGLFGDGEDVVQAAVRRSLLSPRVPPSVKKTQATRKSTWVAMVWLI